MKHIMEYMYSVKYFFFPLILGILLYGGGLCALTLIVLSTDGMTIYDIITDTISLLLWVLYIGLSILWTSIFGYMIFIVGDDV